MISPDARGAGESEAPWPKPRTAWSVVFLLLLAYSLSFADRMVMSLMIGPIKQDLAISDFQVSLLIGFAFALFYVLMGLPFGYLADRFNRRNMIALGIAAWSVATGLCGAAGGFVTLFLARMAIGAGEATLAPAAYSLLSDYFPRERLGRAISVYVIGNPLGTGLALTLGGLFIAMVTKAPTVTLPLFGEIASWRLVFIGLALPGLVLAVVMLTVAEPPRRGALKLDQSQRHWAAGLRFIASRRATFLCQLGGTALLSAAVYGTMAWVPTYFIRSHGVSAADAGFYYGLSLGIGGVIGLLAGGALGDRLYQRGVRDAHPRIMAGAALIALAPSVAGMLVDDPALAFILIALGVTATGITNGVSATAVQLITPGHLRGQVTSLYVLTASIAGIGLGPTAVAAITDYGFGDEASLRYSLAITSAVTLPAAALLLLAGLPHYRDSVRHAEAER